MTLAAFTRVAAIAVVATQLSGCWVINDRMKAMEGKHKSDLLAEWGPPTQVMAGENGGEIWIYSEDRTWVNPGQETTRTNGTARVIGRSVYGNETSTTTYTPPTVSHWKAYRMFWIDPEGRVVRWSWKGL